MAFQEEHQRTFDDSRRITNKFNVNDDTFSSRSRTPDLSLKINDGRSLTLAEFVERIETESGQVVERVSFLYTIYLCTSLF